MSAVPVRACRSGRAADVGLPVGEADPGPRAVRLLVDDGNAWQLGRTRCQRHHDGLDRHRRLRRTTVDHARSRRHAQPAAAGIPALQARLPASLRDVELDALRCGADEREVRLAVVHAPGGLALPVHHDRRRHQVKEHLEGVKSVSTEKIRDDPVFVAGLPGLHEQDAARVLDRSVDRAVDDGTRNAVLPALLAIGRIPLAIASFEVVADPGAVPDVVEAIRALARTVHVAHLRLAVHHDGVVTL